MISFTELELEALDMLKQRPLTFGRDHRYWRTILSLKKHGLVRLHEEFCLEDPDIARAAGRSAKKFCTYWEASLVRE